MRNVFTEMEKLMESTVFTYHLVDGSYIMAEEVDYDFEDALIYVINPVKISRKDEGYIFTQWSIVEPSQPVILKDNMIIASSEAGTALKHNYFQFNMLHLMKNHLTELEFNQIIKLIFPVVDSKETKQSGDIDFNQPFRFKKSKNENKNPWNRY